MVIIYHLKSTATIGSSIQNYFDNPFWWRYRSEEISPGEWCYQYKWSTFSDCIKFTKRKKEIQPMQPMQLSITLSECILEKRQKSATSVILHLLGHQLWGTIRTCTEAKSQTNATNVTLHPPMQVLCGHIWKYIVEKNQANATSVTMHALIQVLWGHIWNRTLEKNQTNVRGCSRNMSAIFGRF